MTDAAAIARMVACAYQFEGPALELGGLMADAESLADVRIKTPVAMMNRHGPVAGATGTGKTKTPQLMTEQLSSPAKTGTPAEVFFVTQSPTDVPEDVLGQLGSRLQHQLRVNTPNDAKALKLTVNTYPPRRATTSARSSRHWASARRSSR